MSVVHYWEGKAKMYAKAVWKHPFIFAFVGIVLGVFLSLNFANIESNNEMSSMLPEGVATITMLQDSNSLFAAGGSLAFLVSVWDDNNNVITKDYLLAVWDLLEDVKWSNHTTDYCMLVSGSTDICLEPGPLMLWDNRTELANDPDVLATINAREGSATKLGIVFAREDYFGEIVESGGDIVSAHGFIINVVLKKTSSSYDYIDVMYDSFSKHNFAGTVLSDARKGALSMTVFQDEMNKELESSGSLMAGGFVIMIIFLFIVNGGYNWVTSRHLLTIAGISIIGLSILSGYGAAAYFGAYSNPLSVAAALLVLGLSADAILLENAAAEAAHRRYGFGTEAGFVDMISHALPPIIMTNISDACAFAVGLSSNILNIRDFSILASSCSILCLLFHSLIYVPLLSLDERRIGAGRNSLMPCIRHDITELEKKLMVDVTKSVTLDENVSSDSDKVKEEIAMPLKKQGFWYNYSRFISHPFVRILIWLVFFGGCAYGVYHANSLSTDLPEYELLPQNSPTRHFMFDMDKFASGLEPSIVCVNCRYYDKDIQAQFNTIINAFNSSSACKIESIGSQLFKSLAASLAINPSLATCMDGSMFPLNQTCMDLVLGTILSVELYEQAFGSSIALGTAGDFSTMKAFRVTISSEDFEGDEAGNDLLSAFMEVFEGETVQNALDVIKQSPLDSTKEVKLLLADSMAPYLEQAATTIPTALTSVGYGLGIIFLVSTLFLGHPILCALLVFLILVLDGNIVAIMIIRGQNFTTVTSICVLVSCGVAIDLSAHVLHLFMAKRQQYSSTKDVLQSCFTRLGAAVINSAFTTWLGISLCLFGNFLFLSFFWSMTYIVGGGLLVAMVILPTFLSLFPDAKYDMTKKVELEPARQIVV
ncbi:hypothetical protein PCE1_001014 [Barthelona sp. PCE]